MQAQGPLPQARCVWFGHGERVWRAGDLWNGKAGGRRRGDGSLDVCMCVRECVPPHKRAMMTPATHRERLEELQQQVGDKDAHGGVQKKIEEVNRALCGCNGTCGCVCVSPRRRESWHGWMDGIMDEWTLPPPPFIHLVRRPRLGQIDGDEEVGQMRGPRPKALLGGVEEPHLRCGRLEGERG